jgi:tRNA uracil 4-sulfurtransferase
MTLSAVALLSGGIDSPVATHLAMASGIDVACLHLDIEPPGNHGPNLQKIEAIVDRLEVLSGRKLPLYVLAHHATQEAFATRCKVNLTCVLCKRMMLRCAGTLAARVGARAIVTGEAIGQVASQTLSNLASETSAAGDCVIIRPLIGLDKQEIVNMAERIGTFGLSIQKGCSCAWVPAKPSTISTLKALKEEESRLDLQGIVDSVFAGLRKIR